MEVKHHVGRVDMAEGRFPPMMDTEEFTMRKHMKSFGLFALLGVVCSQAMAEVDAGVQTALTGLGADIVLYIAAIVAVVVTVIGAALGLRALIAAYRKVVGFFSRG